MPRRPGDIDVATFRALTGRTDVTAVRLTGEDHGTALRARLEVDGGAGLPSRAFVKLAPVRPAEAVFNRVMNLAHNEALAYWLLRDDLGDAIPAVYGTAARRGRAIVLLEDLSDRDARFPALADGASAEEALAVARALGAVHRRFWGRGDDAALAAFAPNRSRSTRLGPHSWHLLRTIPRDFDDIVTPDIRDTALGLIRRRREIARMMRDEPATLLHGDTHLGNICFVGGQAVLFDWQMASVGPAVKDLAYFAGTSLDVDIRREIDAALVNAYVDSLNNDGVQRLTVEKAWESYRLFAFTGFIAAGVTAAFGKRLQGVATTRAGLQRAVAAMTDLGSLELLENRLR
ncbi:phosphotransferase [Mycobacterium sp. NPDC003323]